jgi:hypothetical protein
MSVLKMTIGEGFKWSSGVMMWQDTKSDWKDANQESVDGLSDGLVGKLLLEG